MTHCDVTIGNGQTLDVPNRFHENKVLQTTQTMGNNAEVKYKMEVLSS